MTLVPMHVAGQEAFRQRSLKSRDLNAYVDHEFKDSLISHEGQPIERLAPRLIVS